jgi:hypothetical protein
MEGPVVSICIDCWGFLEEIKCDECETIRCSRCHKKSVEALAKACKIQRQEAARERKALAEQLRMSDIARQCMADALVAVGVEATPGWGLERLAEALRDVTPVIEVRDPS